MTKKILDSLERRAVKCVKCDKIYKCDMAQCSNFISAEEVLALIREVKLLNSFA